MATSQPMGAMNPKTGMTHDEMRQFVRSHFEEFVNRKNLAIGEVNFASEFVGRGTDVPPGSGIVIWRIAYRQLVERWAYLTVPKQVGV
jgi:hypothetical protein